MSYLPPADSADPDFQPPTGPCIHCITGGGTHFERWDWTLLATAHESAVQLYRDGQAKLTIPLTPDQVELLMDGPVTLFGILGEGL